MATLADFRRMPLAERGEVVDRHPMLTALVLSPMGGAPILLMIVLMGGLVPALVCGCVGAGAGTGVGTIYQRRRR